MVDQITHDRIVEITTGYAIEFDLPNGEQARLVGTSKEGLLSSARELYAHQQKPADEDHSGPNAIR